MGLFSRNQSNKSSTIKNGIKNGTSSRSEPDFISSLLEPKINNTANASASSGKSIPLGYDESLSSLDRAFIPADSEAQNEQEQFEQALHNGPHPDFEPEEFITEQDEDDTLEYLFDDTEDAYDMNGAETPQLAPLPYGDTPIDAFSDEEAEQHHNIYDNINTHHNNTHDNIQANQTQHHDPLAYHETHEPIPTQHRSNPAMTQEQDTAMATSFNFQHEHDNRPNNVGVFSRNRGQGGTLTPHEPSIRNTFSSDRSASNYEGSLPNLPHTAAPNAYPQNHYAQQNTNSNQNTAHTHSTPAPNSLSTNHSHNAQQTPNMTTPAKTTVSPNTANSNRMKYGIGEAIKLLRQLPETGDVTVLMTIVKRTLETTGINVQDIIRDAQIKKRDIQSRVHQLEGEIRKLETQVRTRNAEIETLNSEFAETEQVQELLELAEMPAPTKFTRDEIETEDMGG